MNHGAHKSAKAIDPHKVLSLRQVLPNLITLLSLSFGVTSLKFAIAGNFEISVGCIFISIFFDGIDGSIARRLKVTSIFGAQLDSLSDFVCFGVAPPLILYLWSLKNLKIFGWTAVIIYVLAIILRLARFNSEVIEPKKKFDWQASFFDGVPSPAAAAMILLPLILEFNEIYLSHLRGFNWICAIFTITTSILAASKFPTFSLKKVPIMRKNLPSIMLAIGTYIIMLIGEPWGTLMFSLAIYILMLPIGALRYRKNLKAVAT